MLRVLGILLAALVVAAFAGWAMTRPATVDADAIAAITPDLARGELVFHISGCASCHAEKGSEGEARLVLKGGVRLESEFGTFVAPNISSHPEAGIGGWSTADIVNAVMHGTSPGGQHYYPAFPYGSYGQADLADIVSLAAYLQTLPADPTPSEPNDLAFPFTIRAGVGLWKLVNGPFTPVIDVGDDARLQRGQYLAETLGHCGECHTPRNTTQGLDTTRWFAGAPNPSGRGNIPNITPGALTWSEADIVAYLQTGFTPEFDVAGGSMTSVVQNLSNLPFEDLEAIAAYVKAVPPVK
ncbi:MAG: cytochrome c [Pseudomonadota bacterium]